MTNKVGDHALSDKQATALLKTIHDAVEQLRPHGITLASDERKRLLRPRIGAETHLQRVHDLAVKHGVSLKATPLEDMQNDIALAKQLSPFVDALRAGLTLAEDTVAQADSEAWEAFLSYYGVLQTMAERDAALAAELEPVAEFMARAKRTKKAPPTTT